MITKASSSSPQRMAEKVALDLRLLSDTWGTHQKGQRVEEEWLGQESEHATPRRAGLPSCVCGPSPQAMPCSDFSGACQACCLGLQDVKEGSKLKARMFHTPCAPPARTISPVP